jgi:hypothetical protein
LRVDEMNILIREKETGGIKVTFCNIFAERMPGRENEKDG